MNPTEKSWEIRAEMRGDEVCNSPFVLKLEFEKLEQALEIAAKITERNTQMFVTIWEVECRRYVICTRLIDP